MHTAGGVFMNSIHDINKDALIQGRTYTPSPDSWENEVLYFLVADRFSNGQEQCLYNRAEDYENALATPQGRTAWDKSGSGWVGGTLNGICSKLDYLKNLGITAVWVSPIFRQVSFCATYHGYGIQNFLAVDPHFGTESDLRRLVDEAHRRGMYIILDVILNHTGNVFTYKDGDPPYSSAVKDVAGFNDAAGIPSIPPEGFDAAALGEGDGIRPIELMRLETFSRKGHIEHWDSSPDFIDGDFFSLKNVFTGTGNAGDAGDFQPSQALTIITECYKYWIAAADIDGFRLDTVKHVQPGATRYFAREIHEFAAALGKTNFYIIGEITGGFEFALDMKRRTGIDAALGINRIPDALENTAKGWHEPDSFFNLFKNEDIAGEEENRWYKDSVVTMFDDHDMVTQQEFKSRFCADTMTAPLVVNALMLNLMSPGIPCIYYGTEQQFDGAGGDDKYIREGMFECSFGAFRTTGRHFFNTENAVYTELARLTAVRKKYTTLRQGRTYVRMVSYEGSAFEVPHKIGNNRHSGVIAWSRILSDEEMLMVINCDLEHERHVAVAIDSTLNTQGAAYNCVYRTGTAEPQDCATVDIRERVAFIKITVPAAGGCIWKKSRS